MTVGRRHCNLTTYETPQPQLDRRPGSLGLCSIHRGTGATAAEDRDKSRRTPGKLGQPDTAG